MAGANAGAPSVLVAYGEEAVRRLTVCGIPGQLIALNNTNQVSPADDWEDLIGEVDAQPRAGLRMG